MALSSVDPGLITSIHIIHRVAHTIHKSSAMRSNAPILTSMGARHTCGIHTHMQAKHSNM